MTKKAIITDSDVECLVHAFMEYIECPVNERINGMYNNVDCDISVHTVRDIEYAIRKGKTDKSGSTKKAVDLYKEYEAMEVNDDEPTTTLAFQSSGYQFNSSIEIKTNDATFIAHTDLQPIEIFRRLDVKEFTTKLD